MSLSKRLKSKKNASDVKFPYDFAVFYMHFRRNNSFLKEANCRRCGEKVHICSVEVAREYPRILSGHLFWCFGLLGSRRPLHHRLHHPHHPHHPPPRLLPFNRPPRVGRGWLPPALSAKTVRSALFYYSFMFSA